MSEVLTNLAQVPLSQQPVFDELRVKEWGLQQPLDNITLKSFQLIGSHFGKKRRRFILSIAPGGGKTIVALDVETSLALKDLVSGSVILCNKNAYGTWLRHIKKYWPNKSAVIVQGQHTKRHKLWRSPADYFICSPSAFLSDMGKRATNSRSVKMPERIVPDWIFDNDTGIIVDEYHRFMRNRSSKFFDLMQEITPTKNCLILVTGSPASKGPQDMWTALNLCDPKMFSSYWRYVGAYCIVDDSGMGKVIIGPKNTAAWRNVVGNYIFVRSKEQIAGEMPPKIRSVRSVIMSDNQEKMYRAAQADLLHQLPDDSFMMMPTGLELALFMRKLLVSPKMIDPSYEYGPGLEYIADKIEELELDKAVVFTCFRKAQPIIGDFFREKGFEVFHLHGGISFEELQARRAAWAASPRSIMTCTIAYAQSFELVESYYAAVLGPDFDPENNKQAEDRLNRISATEPTQIDYISHMYTYEEDIIALLAEKARNVRSMFNNAGEVKKLLQGMINVETWQPLPDPIGEYGSMDLHSGVVYDEVDYNDDDDGSISF
ncbi:MAG: SNF2-related protein [Waterburya sp.]